MLLNLKHGSCKILWLHVSNKSKVGQKVAMACFQRRQRRHGFNVVLQETEQILCLEVCLRLSILKGDRKVFHAVQNAARN